MKFTTIYFATTVAIASEIIPAIANDRADECLSIGATLIAKTGSLSVVRFTSAPGIIFNHPSADEIDLICMMKSPSLTLSVETAKPDADFFNLVGGMGEIVTTIPAVTVEMLGRQCHVGALASDDELNHVTDDNIEIECQSFERDGGATTIEIYRSTQ